MSRQDTITTLPPPVAIDTLHKGVARPAQVSVAVPDSIHDHTDTAAAPGTTFQSAVAAPVAYPRPVAQRLKENLGPFYKDFEVHQSGGISVATEPSDSLSSDVLPTDSLAVDTVPVQHVFGVLLTPPPGQSAQAREDNPWGMSYIFGGLLLLFCIIGIRFHNSRRYVSVMLRNLVEVRERSNVFDETVRETSFLVLLNLMWSCSAGILLYSILCHTFADIPEWYSFGLPALSGNKVLSIGVCMGVMAVYTCFMALAYYMVGCVFSDGLHAKIWLKGFTAGQGLLSFIYLPLALLLLCRPEWTEILLWIALGTFVLSKIVFIWKGFRIFFTQISSWLLFLYYLCSLEIVPLILTYLAGMWFCSLLH